MFQWANGHAANFTWPITTCRRHFDDTCTCGMATLTVVNNEGWFITAAHVFDDFFAGVNQIKEANEHQAKRLAIESDTSLSRKERQKRLFALNKVNPKATKNISFWPGRDGVNATNIGYVAELDLAWGQLAPFDAAWVPEYPTFKNPDMNFGPGTSLCKLGFPFHEITPIFDQASGAFTMPPEAFPAPLFPIEGIFTRTIQLPSTITSPTHPLLFLETSSPGLRGQSGGPIFDTKGRIWGMQARTLHYELGFETNVKQFLNAGAGPHVKSILSALSDAGIMVTVSQD